MWRRVIRKIADLQGGFLVRTRGKREHAARDTAVELGLGSGGFLFFLSLKEQKVLMFVFLSDLLDDFAS